LICVDCCSRKKREHTVREAHVVKKDVAEECPAEGIRDDVSDSCMGRSFGYPETIPGG
jgi:hypothetical protein